MKRLICIFVIITILMFSEISVFAVSRSDNRIIQAQTPISSATAVFTKNFGSSYRSAPTPPVVVDDSLLVVSGVKLYKLDAQTGEEIESVKIQGNTLYATIPPLYADGKVFVQLDGGIIQAFDYETMKSLWIYTDLLGGQALCPITYDNGCIYTGFWNDETENANYVCLSVNDELTSSETESKEAEWTFSALGGFYWAGCAVTEKYIVFGKDDGQTDSESNSQIISLDKLTGEKVSVLTVKGDIRSSVTYSEGTNSFYVSSKAGYVYKFSMNPSTGKLDSLTSYAAAGSVTATPVVYGDRLYVGCQNGSAGEFIVLNASTMEEIYTAEMIGYPQGSMLVSTGYESETGKIYIYSTYNQVPGGITVFEDSRGQSKAVKSELFTPDSSMSQYCISTISASEDGTLYYKNDSGVVFAVAEKDTDGQSVYAEFIEIIITLFLKLIELLTSK